MMQRWAGFLVLFYLMGCATPLEQSLGPASGTPKLEQGIFTSADGKKLAVQVWNAEAPEAVMIGLHGMNDYAKTFEMPGPWFSDHAITTYAFDQRGFGRSPQPGIWPGSDLLINDARTFIRLVRDRHPNLPIYVLAVSMGGAAAISMFAEQDPPQIDGLILVAPAVWGWSSMNPIYKAALWVAAHTFPQSRFTGESLDILPSDNLKMLRDNYYDDLMIKETRTDAIYGLVGLMDKGYLSVEQVSVPTLVLYGEKDQIIPRKPVEDILDRIGGPTRVVEYKNGYHMLLRDLQAEVVWQDIAAWIKDPLGDLPSAEERQKSADRLRLSTN